MKKINRWLVLFLFVFIGSLLLLTGCGRSALQVPSKLQLDPITLMLSWKEVKGAAYYTVSIEGGDEEIQKDSSKNTYSLERLAEGDYVIRVKAVASGGDGEHKDSEWSEKITFTREHETGLSFRLIDNDTAFEVSGIGSAEGVITVPDTYRGLPVTKIGTKAFYNRKELTCIMLGDNITEIGKQAFANCSYLTDANLPKNLKAIGAQAFQSCRALASAVVIPDGVTELGDQAFSYCQQLPSVTFGKGVTTIGTGVFQGCSSLSALDLPDTVVTVGEAAFAKCSSLADVRFGGVTEIGKDAFRQCTALTELSLGKQVLTVGESAFADCTALRTITMTDSVTELDASVFAGCTALSEITHMSSALTHIGADAFTATAFFDESDGDLVYAGLWFIGCKSGDMSNNRLAEGTVGISDRAFAGCAKFPDILTLPDSVKYIGKSAFSGCENLINVVIGAGVTEIGDNAFYNFKKLTRIILGSYDRSAEGGLGMSALTQIGNYAFDGCYSLSEIEIPATVRMVGRDAFINTHMYVYAEREVYAGNWLVSCKSDGSYGTLVVRDGTVGIANYAFYNVKGVTGVTIPDSVMTVGRGAFYYCRDLETVNLPQTLAVIEDYTFYHCDNLLLPVLPQTLTRIGRAAFYKCRLIHAESDTAEDKLVIPNRVTEIGMNAFYGCSRTYPDPATGENVNVGIDILELGANTTTVGDGAFYGITTMRRVVMGDSLATIGEKAFYRCSSLAEISFGKGLTTVGTKAFYECSSLCEVLLPDSVKDIGNYAFYHCTTLETLSLGGVERIGDAAFSGCSSLSVLRLPTTLTEIGRQSFRGCTALSGVVLPSTVTTVGAHAFYGCKQLTVYIHEESVPESWNARWNSSYRPVVVGATLTENGDVYGFTKKADNPKNLSEIYMISAPARNGYTFIGWATAPEGTVEYAPDAVGDVPDGTGLYAVYTAKD